MRIRSIAGSVLITLSLLSTAPVYAQNCEYFLGYIADEAERPYAVKKVYRYTPERITEILKLRDQGAELCNSGSKEQGVRVLMEAVKLINFTRLR
ncbi:MAG: hypothetical protein HWE12_04150 [Oceanospirillaceae bacterium]|nr:hypothetical protein [Oceanospirillaceae bacterium]